MQGKKYTSFPDDIFSRHIIHGFSISLLSSLVAFMTPYPWISIKLSVLFLSSAIGFKWELPPIILNVFILLFGFLCCEKAKTYQVRGSFYLIGLGVINFLRILWIPLQLITYGNLYKNGDLAQQEAAKDFLGKTIVNTDGQVNWLPADGTFRGLMAIILLVLAGVFMIVGGIIGFLKAKKLSAYLDSLKETK